MKKIIMNRKTIALTLLTVMLSWGVQSTSYSFFGNIINAVEDIIDEGEEVIEDVEDTVEDVVDEVENIVEDVEDTAEDVIDEVENVFESVVDVFEGIEDTVTQIIPGITDVGIERGATVKWNRGELRNIVTSSFNSDLIAVNLSNHINLWDPLTKEVIATLPYETAITFIDFSSDGLLLASGGIDKTVQLWDTQTQKLIARFKGHTNEILTVAFSPDSVMLASGGRDKIVRLWNIKTRKRIAKFKGHTERVKSVAFSPNGSILASSGVDGVIRLWSTETQQLIRTLEGIRVPYPMLFLVLMDPCLPVQGQMALSVYGTI